MLNLNIYGYLTGWLIALTTVSLAFYTGMLYERHLDVVITTIEEINK